jgi:hypothetical protein
MNRPFVNESGYLSTLNLIAVREHFPGVFSFSALPNVLLSAERIR